ncbi:MAG: hypothetical protein R3E12_17940 [Candidatus Eisenbacteria bacterium]
METVAGSPRVRRWSTTAAAVLLLHALVSMIPIRGTDACAAPAGTGIDGTYEDGTAEFSEGGSLPSRPDEAPNTSEPLYFRWGPRWFDFDLVLDDRVTPVSEDFTYERSHAGVDLAVGYDFGRRFGLEGDIAFTSLSPSPADAQAFLSNVTLIGLIPILRYGPHEMRVAGGLGITALYQDGPDFPERIYIGTAGLVGARLRLQVRRHLRLNTGVDYTVQDTRWEIVPSKDSKDEVRNVGGTAWIRSAFAGLELCF